MSAPHSQPTISFRCPHCGHQTDVEARFAGQSGPCVGCSNTITIPTLDSPRARTLASPNTPQSVWLVRVAITAGIVTAIVMVVIVGMSVIRPVMAAARQAAATADCEANLLAIGRALEGYYQTHGKYPPAVIRDEQGKAMHSWRVLILPHLGPDAELIFREYKMDEPWDGPNNKQLWTKIPDVYRCPSDPALVPEETSYLAVVSDRTLINSQQPTKRTGDGDYVLTDRPGETLVVLESKNSGVNWMEPADIPFASLRAELNSSNAASPGSEHLHGVNVLMADGSVVRLPDYTSASDLRGMATINGNNELIDVLDEIYE